MRTRKHRGFILALIVIVEAYQEAEKAMRRPITITWLPYRVAIPDPYRSVPEAFWDERREAFEKGTVFVVDDRSNYPMEASKLAMLGHATSMLLDKE